MQLSPTLASFLTPNQASIKFAIKGIISMAFALFVSMFLDLERPYWALVSAVFLQMRPESGLVIEKGICQIIGSVAGGIVAILILNFLMPYPILALGLLTIWVAINAAASALVHSLNFIYAFAMAGMTACLIVVLVMVSPSTADGAAVFNIAQARISEIVVGTVCATLISLLIWPVRVKDILRVHARTVINKTLDYLVVELDPKGSHEARHTHADAILTSLIGLSDDSSAVVYEGPEGAGRARAADLLCNKVLSVLAMNQVFGRFQRNHSDLLSQDMRSVLSMMRERFQSMADTTNYSDCYQLSQQLRRELLEFHANLQDSTPLQSRLIKTSIELVSDLVVVIKAYDALETSSGILLKAPSLSTHRDYLLGAIIGFRTMAVFVIGAVVWIGSAAPAAVMMMILPLTFSVMFARLPSPTMALGRLLVGVLVAIPVALFLGLGLLAQSSGDFEILILIMAGPFFVGLLALSNRLTLPYGLGFCITFTILVQPSNSMTFAVGSTLSTALGIVVGVGVLYWVFKLITPPDSQLMQSRLIKSTAKDLAAIGQHKHPENWFNGRMGQRLMLLSGYEQGSATGSRQMTDLGLTGLNLGHVSIRLRRDLKSQNEPNVRRELEKWQQSLAFTYMQSAKGKVSDAFRLGSNSLLTSLQDAQHNPQQLEIIEGMFERMTLTFQRTAQVIGTSKV
ncbi:FUSC family protein [Paraglaciecola sp.]|uniref:FUSC family protein n=1 Tax=Paraglaciecola sp. TaxID=1920173 RepID=UPI0030F4318E